MTTGYRRAARYSVALLLSILLVWPAPGASAQPYLSNLSATGSDPLFATYAAPLERSTFIVDEGYRFQFYEPDRPIQFVTDHAGTLALAFRRDGDVRYRLDEMHAAPVVTTSYSDLVRYHFQPYEDLRVDVHFQVYSSELALVDLQLTNTGSTAMTVDLYPTLQGKELRELAVSPDRRYVTFRHREPLDGWMKRKRGQVPYVPERIDVLRLSTPAEALAAYAERRNVPELLRREALRETVADTARAVILQKHIRLQPGATTRLRIVRGVRGAHHKIEALVEDSRELLTYDVEQDVRRNEALYRSIPQLPEGTDEEKRLMYWSAFNLIRQCMMPAEGKSSYNYYVFSREPTWGWGYAGQVFHESLTMLAYVFMDPESAQNSQRVYMERQWENGYIYYRIGPYLEAMNFVNGDFTSSAPWFNWINWKLYEQTGDRQFLQDAYISGSDFYGWWREHRDQDNDGLMEWGGHAVLESVRDAQVALWRDVGWPSNFESPDLNAMLVKEARSLAHMAKALGKPDAQAHWLQEAQTLRARIQQTFWDDETGFFYYVDRKDQDFTFEEPDDLKRQAITGFIPLWAEVATPAQAERLVEIMTDPEKFWRPYGIPSLAADDPFYNPRGYWNGPVWVEWQFLMLRGLLNYGYDEQAHALAGRVFDNVIYNLKEDHTFWEFYSPDSRWAGHHQTYIWTGLVARMLLDINQLADK